MFEITRMTRRDDCGLVADFDVEISGVTLTGCGLRRRGDDFITYAPRGFSRPGTRSVWLSPEAKAALDDAGRRVAVELGFIEDDDDEGLRRVIGETCERAGL
ncbi:hypothetical protein [Aerobium aerolatum]|uniref:Uncharacterized protein n=1 Tax=Aquamicrobium aerolatum DSM 21857 TaxID=1121003 RepID=A0A1I3JHN1_9HYPH|nr:hypothetical protein [Aquamicrobium aerolatum]SFI59425.1 hypothetical protein SAMN03080618_00850 [Aquamicrobium aerolatum DSM 21857]